MDHPPLLGIVMFLDEHGNVWDDEYFHEFHDGPDLSDLTLAPEFMNNYQQLIQDSQCETKHLLCQIFGCPTITSLDAYLTERLSEI